MALWLPGVVSWTKTAGHLPGNGAHLSLEGEAVTAGQTPVSGKETLFYVASRLLPPGTFLVTKPASETQLSGPNSLNPSFGR